VLSSGNTLAVVRSVTLGQAVDLLAAIGLIGVMALRWIYETTRRDL
jgi:hypothetical protein